MRPIWRVALAACALSGAVAHAVPPATQRNPPVIDHVKPIRPNGQPPSALAGMAPGDAVTHRTSLAPVSAFRYRITVSASGSPALAGALQLSVKAGVPSCTARGFAHAGRTLYDGPLAGATFGSPADEPRADAALCLQVRLPLSGFTAEPIPQA